MSELTDTSSDSGGDEDKSNGTISNTSDSDSDDDDTPLAKLGANAGGKGGHLPQVGRNPSKSQISGSPHNRPSQPIPEPIPVMMTNEYIQDDLLITFECSIMASRLPLLCLVFDKE